MRSLLSFGASKEDIPTSGAPGARPEILRRKTLALNSRLVVIASGIGLPFALYGLFQGLMLPFLVVMLTLAGGMVTLALHQRGEYDMAAAGQVTTIVLLGLVLSVVNPAVVDFGLAIALLAPIYASLMASTGVQKKTWLSVIVAVIAAVLSGFELIAWPEVHRPEFSVLAGVTFTAVAILVAISANRLSRAYAVFDRAQVNAYRHLVEHLQDAVVRLSADGDVLFVSRSSETLFGCRRFELAGNGLVERVHVADRPAFLTALADANQGGKTRTIEVRMRHDDINAPSAAPQFVWMHVGLTPVIDQESRADRHEVVALFRDVTEHKDYEARLRTAQKAAEDASDAKSRFLAIIGHELRTPLNAIVGFAEMMTSNIGGELSPTHREYAGLIHQSGHHLLDVVKMLLDMSRIEAGKFEIQAEPFEPDTLVEPCLQMVGPMARQRHIAIDVDVARMMPNLIADERACRQILINLLSNAVKFSHEGGRVGLQMRRQGRNIAISISDQGIGMGPESVRRIGEPFFQADDSLARAHEGTGLGLSIVKGLVDLHNGTLHVLSAPGQGTTMTVFLPVNGPATKLEETASVTPLHREPVPQQPEKWHDLKRKAL